MKPLYRLIHYFTGHKFERSLTFPMYSSCGWVEEADECSCGEKRIISKHYKGKSKKRKWVNGQRVRGRGATLTDMYLN